MKRLIQYLLVLTIIAVSGYVLYFYSLDPCQKSIEYSIGRFDTQFGVSRADFQSYIAEGALVWEKVLNKKVFIYDPDASFKINLIYDERQLETVQKQKSEFGLLAVEETFKALDNQFSLFKSQYDQKVNVYERNLALYKKGKYSNAEIEILNKQATELNKEAVQLDTLLKARNAKALEYNKIVEAYNEKYNHDLEFNQAEYIGNPANNKNGEINVYQFGNKKDLILALTHEFGHALGMDHVENAKSIMYFITSTNVEIVPAPTAEDLAELQRVCKK